MIDIDRLKKMLLAAENHPEGVPSKGWKADGDRWFKTKGDLFVEVRRGFALRNGWVPPYVRCFDWGAKERSASGVQFDIPAPTILEAMEVADQWLDTGVAPENVERFEHPN